MGIWPGDIFIKAAIDLGLEEMRKNEWLLDDVFRDLTLIPYVADKYGNANIKAAKEWFANNKINVYLKPHNDKDTLPCVSIYPGPSSEKPEMKTLGDASVDTIILKPNEIGKSIPYVVKPFTPEGYSPATGEVFVGNNVDLGKVAYGMSLVNPATGEGFKILGVEPDAIQIQPNADIDATQLAVVPRFPYFKANIEETFCNEVWTVGCHAHGTTQNIVWLHAIILYTLYRYRESLLEGTGFAESFIDSSELMDDPNYSGPDGEEAYQRMISLKGQIRNTWIKAPKRFIENSTDNIKVFSNLDAPPEVDKQDVNWYTINENEQYHHENHEDSDDEDNL